MPKSNGAPKGSAESAANAAAVAFRQRPSLPLNAEVVPAPAIQGRKRLAGAFTIELSRIRPDPNQPRKNLETEAQVHLTESVLRVGIVQPITVRSIEGQNFYQIISGQRRYHACLAAELTAIPCWIQNPEPDAILLH
ncbi:MAG: ParB N-terminal domain-containing protein, partial [Gemmataceae bacterium]